MSKFILGIIFTLVVLAIGGLAIAMLGFVPTQCRRESAQAGSSILPTPLSMPPWTAALPG